VSALARFFSRARVREESGWLIMEIMMGALVLIVGGIAIYNGVDGASKTSGLNRNRSVAAYLAQQDQERMRAMDAAELSNGYTNTRTVNVDNVNYTVKSAASSVNDSTGSVSCTNASSTAQYLKISSTVLDPAARNAPVVQDSLLSPKPDDGNAVVKIVDRGGTTGVQGVAVTLQQPPGDTISTDTNGCALFSFLDNFTNYSVSFAQPTYVNVNGVNAITGPITVVPATVSVTQFQYDIAGTITASFDSKVNGSSTATATTGTEVTFADSHMTLTPATRLFPTGGGSTFVSSINGTNLFPFLDQYSVYAGDCKFNDPNQWGQPQTFAPILGPGQTKTVTVREPAINVKTQLNSTTTSGADVHIKQTDLGCSNSYTDTSTASGALNHPPYPYGTYSVCVDYNGGDSNTVSIPNTNANGTSTTTINVSTLSNNGNCP
jgi:Tfp pilus assembly protein PilV